MKSLYVEKMADVENEINAISAYFQKKSNSYQYIDMINWPLQYPYKPDCRFKTGYTETHLWIQFYVRENPVKAIYLNDNEAVWEDSCVEFFCKRPNQKSYYNFEFNCIGTALAAERMSKTEGVQAFESDKMLQIKRVSTLGRKAFAEKAGLFEWFLTVGIPFELINFKPETNARLEANFYKCADETTNPHFLSWNNITTTEPDFHRPEFFGKLIF